jgi:hypothetical protein
VIAAAIEVFAERGLEATVPEVAARAGVGKATVYRSRMAPLRQPGTKRPTPLTGPQDTAHTA